MLLGQRSKSVQVTRGTRFKDIKNCHAKSGTLTMLLEGSLGLRANFTLRLGSSFNGSSSGGRDIGGFSHGFISLNRSTENVLP
jgi:hypothetical protein